MPGSEVTGYQKHWNLLFDLESEVKGYSTDGLNSENNLSNIPSMHSLNFGLDCKFGLILVRLSSLVWLMDISPTLT